MGRSQEILRARPRAGFVAMELYFVEVDFRTCSPVDRSHVLTAELVHRYDPQGVVPADEPADLWRFAEPGPMTAESEELHDAV